MATISSPGLGSGLDVNSIITQLMQVESRPLTALTKQEASYQAKLSAFGSMQGALSTLQTAARTLESTSTFTGKSAGVSDSTVLSASAVLTASAGTYEISVTTLAKNHIVHSLGSYELTDTFNGGSLDILIGSTDDGMGGRTGGTNKTVTIADGSTLSQIRDAVNDANAGVKASIVNDGQTNRLIFSSNATGSIGNVHITATQTGGAGTKNITDFGYTGVDGTMKQDRPPDNAIFTVNGLQVTRSSNTIADAISGVTLNLAKEGGAATITVAANTDTVTTAVNAFIKAYNEAFSQLKSMTAYDAANKKASVLTGDSTARNIQSQLSSLVQAEVTGVAGGIGRLSDIGISVQKDGSLALNASKLASALADPSKNVGALFNQTTSGNTGIAVRFRGLLEGFIGVDGVITSRTDGINTSIKSVRKRTDDMNRRLAQIETRYRAQFTALDTLVSSMQKTSQYLTQQLANLPSTSN
jgi:flagellar hook-associated protein 2